MALIDNLIAYYKLDEASGDALDAHNVGPYNMTVNGTVGTGTGILGTGRTFTADGQYFSIASNANFLTGDVDFTAQAWANFSNVGSYCAIVSKDSGGTAREWNLLFNVDETPDAITFNVFSGNTSVGNAVSTVTPISTSTWYHIVGRHTSSSGEVAIFVNGTKTAVTRSGAPVSSNTTPFEIGRATGLGTRGTIDEVGFWKRALSDSEISQLYNGGAGLAYPFSVAGAGGVFPRRPRRRLRNLLIR